jgi:hypothetical protein
MQDQITKKIAAERERGITTESQAVYLLVEIRKFLDRKGASAPAYESLRLYSDWVVHIDLKGPRAQSIVKRADAFYPKLIAGELTKDERSDFGKMFLLDRFREELGQLFAALNIRPFEDTEWNRFLSCLLNVVEDCPLFCKNGGALLANVDEVVVIPNPDRHVEGAPQIIWALCLGGKLRMSVGGFPELSEKVVKAIEDFAEARDA